MAGGHRPSYDSYSWCSAAAVPKLGAAAPVGIEPTSLRRRHELSWIKVSEKRRHTLAQEEAPRDVTDLAGGVARFAGELGVPAKRLADALERAP